MEDYARKPVVPVGRINGATESELVEDFSSSDDDDDLRTEYEQEFVEKEMKRYAQCMSQAESVRYSHLFFCFSKYFLLNSHLIFFTNVFFEIYIFMGLQ